MPVGAQILAIRRQRKLTQVQLAAKSKVSRNYISEIENGTKTPSIPTLEKIAAALGVSTGTLFDHSRSATNLHDNTACPEKPVESQMRQG
ncbi:MAG: XRE family transcriptional regulator [Desulforudis sp.]|nr:MAG: XRE family transcriptional regulator [Desulforudis sp.]